MDTFPADITAKLSRAKSQLVLEAPFFAALLLGIPVEITKALPFPTAATDGEWVGVHPDWINSCNLRQLKWTLAHEVGHCMLMHFMRREGRTGGRWNVAGDVVINCLLEDEKIGERPPGVIWDSHQALGGKSARTLYDTGKTTEGVYRLLPEDGGQGGGGAPGEGGDGYPQWDNCESKNRDPSEQAKVEADWEVKIAQAAATAKACGNFSANLDRLVTEVLKPRVNWADKLRDFFMKRAHIDRSFTRPSRRFLSRGEYLPGKGGVTMGEVVIFVDLSGSISQKECNEFAAEMTAIKEDCQPDVTHVIYFAHSVLGHDSFDQGEPLEIKMNGTGGTAFSPLFRFIDENDIHPMAAVVLTDLECGDFGPAPDYPVLWCSTSRSHAPWGEVIMMRETHA